ncbi:DUF4352 domain-containing protein, partial [Candidatus Bipolaricaulota bacterium]|nr:DUF4352 domain-containing protein [Candidatus Bipolaricaulota bacterium]
GALFLGLTGCFNLTQHFVSTPSRPSGPSAGEVGQLLTYSTGGASCSEGHPIQYRFDWGDGTYSSWSSSTTASKTWNSAGTYQVKAQARCATDPSVVSGWSSALSVSITAPAYGGIGDTRDNGRLAITLRSVRTANKISLFEPDPGKIFLIVDLKVRALRDGASFYVTMLRVTQADGQAHDWSGASVGLPNYLGSMYNMSAGQWTAGEAAFEVYPGQAYYILEYKPLYEDPIRFRFSL